MDLPQKIRAPWDAEEPDSGNLGSGAVDYLRALKRSNEGRSPNPAFPDNPKSPTSGERRHYHRYRCEGSAEIYSEPSNVRVWATLTDLSRSGCYLEMQATSPVNSILNMIVEVRNIRFRVKGVVRISYPFLGMGVAFAEISPADQAHLDELLLLLATAPLLTAPASQVQNSLPQTSKKTNAVAVLEALMLHFQTSCTLTLEEFTDLLARHTAPEP